MGGRDFQHAGTEVLLHRVARLDRNDLARQRDLEHLPAHAGVTVVRFVVDHRDVAEHRLRARGCHGGTAPVARPVRTLVADVVHLAIHVLGLGFLVRERGQVAGTPVNHPVAAIDQAFFMQRDERVPHRLGILHVHGEAGAGPVGGGAQGFQLLEDHAALFPLEGMNPLEKRGASHVLAGLSLLGELLLHHVLRCDRRVVRSRLPQRLAAAHPLEPDEEILHRVIEAVTHVEDVGHVGGRHHDDVGVAR